MLIVHHERMLEHDPGEAHPESPDRLRAATRALGSIEGIRWCQAREASRDELERAHHPEYVARMLELRGRAITLDPDTHTSTGTIEAARLAAGAAIEATEHAVRGSSRRSVALVRPPGHHAERDAAMGFCFFNNVAVAAEHARAVLGCERVLIVDWDVHHGNGTQHMFEERRDVLFLSLHQDPLYPGTGSMREVGHGPGRGYTVNVPCPVGFGDADYAFVLQSILLPIAEAFRPELVLVSAGFDAHEADPLSGMRLTESGYRAMTRIVRDVANRYADGCLVLMLEGGYDLEAMPSSLRACVEVLLEREETAVEPLAEPSDAAREVTRAVRHQHADVWSF